MKKESEKAQKKANDSVQVLVHSSVPENLLVLSIMRDFANRQKLSSDSANNKTTRALLAEDFFGKEKNAAELNAEVNKKIEAAITDGTLKEITKVSEPGKSIYTYNGTSLIQHINNNGNFTFRIVEKFTGILRVYRSVEGKPDPKQKDVVEYKDGIPIAVSRATVGTSKIANIDLLEKQSAVGLEALSNAQEKPSSQAAPPQTSSQKPSGESSE